MNYPKTLPNHPIYSFNANNVLNTEQGTHTKAYYHQLNTSLPHLPIHKHDFYEINIITSGNAMHYIDDNIYEAPLGTVFVIPPNLPHGYFSDEKTDIFHVILSTEFVMKNTGILYSLDGYSFLFHIEPVLRHNSKLSAFLHLSPDTLNSLLPIFNHLASYESIEITNKNTMKNFLTLNIISELCSFVEDISYINHNYSQNTYIIVRILEYISTHYNEKINFKALSEENNISYPTFFRHFKNICHVTPIQYLTEYRINEAIKLIEENKLSLTQISVECGFYDAAHFTKAFEAVKGCSPSAFIKNNIF